MKNIVFVLACVLGLCSFSGCAGNPAPGQDDAGVSVPRQNDGHFDKDNINVMDVSGPKRS